MKIFLVVLCSLAFVRGNENSAPEVHSVDQDQTGDEEIETKDDSDFLNEIEVNQRGGMDLFEGDIMMAPEELEQLKKDFEKNHPDANN